MTRAVLIGLDGSAHSRAAVELGIRWAEKLDCLLVGLGVIDEPEICAPEPVPLGAGSFKHLLDANRLKVAHRKIEDAVHAFSVRCSDAQVSSKPLEDIGDPTERIALEAQRYDLILLGQQTFFRLDASPGDTLRKLLKNAPRPVVAVPEHPCSGEAVLVAYDGSLQATRALQAFAQSRVPSLYGQIHVLCIHSDKVEAARRVDRAVEYLSFQGLQAKRRALTTGDGPAAVILQNLGELNAGLLVMGCYGQSTLHEFFLGSATHDLVEKSPAPVFLYQ